MLNPGDKCLVVGGFTQKASPNVGLTVTVQCRVYGNFGDDHAKFGPMYRCVNEKIQQLGDNGEFFTTGWADFSEQWLQKLPPETLPTKEKEIAA